MARPEKNRNVLTPPSFNNFKPSGVRAVELQQVMLTLDEYEALRLADYDGLDHQQAAKKMDISRPTFSRLIAKARQKMAEFIIEGKSLQIEGGAVHFSENMILCLDCGARYQVAFSKRHIICPECGSENFQDLAQSFGHGRCCRRHRGGRK